MYEFGVDSNGLFSPIIGLKNESVDQNDGNRASEWTGLHGSCFQADVVRLTISPYPQPIKNGFGVRLSLCGAGQQKQDRNGEVAVNVSLEPE